MKRKTGQCLWVFQGHLPHFLYIFSLLVSLVTILRVPETSPSLSTAHLLRSFLFPSPFPFFPLPLLPGLGTYSICCIGSSEPRGAGSGHG